MARSTRLFWRIARYTVISVIGLGGGYEFYVWSKPAFKSTDLEMRPLPTRHFITERLSKEKFDVLVIGGGASGAGIALDATSRGLKTALIERNDFASGTSSKSTKLIHGGVRYLEKAVKHLDYEQFKMVREALQERATFLNIAPHLTYEIPIMLPIYSSFLVQFFKVPYFWAGLKAYDLVALRERLSGSYWMGKDRSLEEFPMLKENNLRGSMVYYDGGQDDARMNVCLVLTATRLGCRSLNHAQVVGLRKCEKTGKLCGAVVKDQTTGRTLTVDAKCIINATGAYTDVIRLMDDPEAQPICAPSSGVHIVLPGFYGPNKMGLLDPKTSDGRVIFFLPWMGHTVAGTTDSPCPLTDDPAPTEPEIQFILREVHKYLGKEALARRCDVLSAWSGIRPLVKRAEYYEDPAKSDTQSLARNHLILVSKNGLITIAGGKWTTFRRMAEETVDKAVEASGLDPAFSCRTKTIMVEGGKKWAPNLHIQLVQDFGLDPDVARHLSNTYGDKALKVARFARLTGRSYPVVGRRLHPEYPYIEAEVIYSVHEYAVTAVDFLARRCRLAFLNAGAARDCLPKVVQLMGDHAGWDEKRRKEELAKAMEFLDKQMGLRLKLDLKSLHRNVLDELKITPNEKKMLQAQFRTLDKENKGYVTLNDMRDYFKRTKQPVNEEQLREILTEVDITNNGQIEFEEYLQLYVALKDGLVKSSRFAMAAQIGVQHEQMSSWATGTQVDASGIERSGGGV